MESVEKRNVAHVAPGESKAPWVSSDLYEFKVNGEDTGGAFALVETTIPPGNPRPPPQVHHNEDEAFYLLEGELEIMAEGRTSAPKYSLQISPPPGACLRMLKDRHDPENLFRFDRNIPPSSTQERS